MAFRGSVSRLKQHLQRKLDAIAAGEEYSSSRRHRHLSVELFGLPGSPSSLLSSLQQEDTPPSTLDTAGREGVTPALETMTGRSLLEEFELLAAEEEGAISLCGSSSADKEQVAVESHGGCERRWFDGLMDMVIVMVVLMVLLLDFCSLVST